MHGKLFVVATPIGHYDDLSSRARTTLSQVDWIAAEDTRTTGKLLAVLAIHNVPLLSLHDFNERERADLVIEKLQQGQNVALVSDAGTPLISDPGYHLVDKARDLGISVVPIPGPCALISALSVAGLPTDRFIFEGFLSAKTATRQARLHELADDPRTLIFYEAPHRVLDLVDDLSQILGGQRQVLIAKEMTKTYETLVRLPLTLARPWFEEKPERQKGEFVFIVAGAPQHLTSEKKQEAERVLAILLAELPLKQAAALAAQICAVPRNTLYKRALELKAQAPESDL